MSKKKIEYILACSKAGKPISYNTSNAGKEYDIEFFDPLFNPEVDDMEDYDPDDSHGNLSISSDDEEMLFYRVEGEVYLTRSIALNLWPILKCWAETGKVPDKEAL